MSSIKFWEGWRVKKLIQTKLPKSCLSSFLELSVQFWQSLRIIIFSCNNISNFLPLKMTATAPPPAEGSWGPSSWVTCTNLQWMLLLTTLAGLLTARSRRSPGSYLPSWGDGGAWVTEGKLKTPGFSQEFGTAGTKKSCRCGRKIFTASPTIKSTERGDLCIWDKGGGKPPPVLSPIYGNMTPITQMSSRSPLAFCRASISWCRMETHCKLYFRGPGCLCFVLMLPNPLKRKAKKILTGFSQLFLLFMFSAA